MKSVAQTVIEADRFYTIAAHTGNVIQAVEGSKDGGTVRLGKYDHKPEQEWSFVREGDGVYRIRNRASGKLLDLTMTGTANGTWLHLWEDVGGTSQMWKVEHTPVDTVGIGAEVGAVLQIWQEVPGGGDQLWVISEVKDRVKRAAKVEQAAPAAETKAAPAKEAAPAKKPAARKPRTAKKVEEKPATPAAKAAEPVKAEKPAAKKAAKAKAEPAAPAVEVKAAPAVATKAEPVTKAEPAAKAAPAAEAKTAPAAAKPKAKRAPCKKTVKK